MPSPQRTAAGPPELGVREQHALYYAVQSYFFCPSACLLALADFSPLAFLCGVVNSSRLSDLSPLVSAAANFFAANSSMLSDLSLFVSNLANSLVSRAFAFSAFCSGVS